MMLQIWQKIFIYKSAEFRDQIAEISIGEKKTFLPMEKEVKNAQVR